MKTGIEADNLLQTLINTLVKKWNPTNTLGNGNSTLNNLKVYILEPSPILVLKPEIEKYKYPKKNSLNFQGWLFEFSAHQLEKQIYFRH